MLEQRIQQHFFDSADLKYQAAETLARPVAQAAVALAGAITGGGKVLLCGRGSAAALALHAETLLLGRFERERLPLPAVALHADGRSAQQLQALGQPGDVLLLIDAGGDAAAGLEIVVAAQRKELTVVLLAGNGGSALMAGLAETDVGIAVPHGRVPRVIELQLLLLHALCDAIDLQLMGDSDP